MTDGPLTGVRIVDLTGVIMGPFATHILADLGADVIKVESADGDLFRRYKPQRSPGMYGGFLNLNRNKRSVLLDLKAPADREVFEKLITTADVFVHSLRPQAIERLGYPYARVRELKSDIVYCGAYGFGAAGPYGDKAAYDDLIQAGAGMAALYTPLTGAPQYMPTVLCDKLGGQAMAYAIAAALYRRAKTGEGDEIEVPMFETAVEFVAAEHFGGFAFEPPIGPYGFPRMFAKSRKPYKTADGYACILPYSDTNWLDFLTFIGKAELLADPRFTKLADRVQNIEILYSLLDEEAVKRPTAEWVAFCDRVSIPCMPVLAFDELPDDVHLKAVGMFSNETHPTEGRYRALRRPITFKSSRFKIRRHAPRLGEHTAQVKSELGFD
jgi:crotonobetainyl-CoA:carnitine CoA-transferase CaiB-like acyl-CoA transferase